MVSRCPYCGWPDDQPPVTLSRHATGKGQTVWTRCRCGSLQARILTACTVEVFTRGRPRTATVPNNPFVVDCDNAKRC